MDVLSIIFIGKGKREKKWTKNFLYQMNNFAEFLFRFSNFQKKKKQLFIII